MEPVPYAACTYVQIYNIHTPLVPEKSPPLDPKYDPFKKKRVFVNVCATLIFFFWFWVTFGVFKILGHIHHIQPLLRGKSYLDVNLFACRIKSGNLAETFVRSRMHGNNCKHGGLWAMMGNDGQGCCHTLRRTTNRSIKLVISLVPQRTVPSDHQ